MQVQGPNRQPPCWLFCAGFSGGSGAVGRSLEPGAGTSTRHPTLQDMTVALLAGSKMQLGRLASGPASAGMFLWLVWLVWLVWRMWRMWLMWLMWLMGAAPLPAAAAEDFLPPEQAFVVSAALVAAGLVEVRMHIVPGYYAYRDPFRFSAVGATLGPAELPAGKVKFDENFQKNVET